MPIRYFFLLMLLCSRLAFAGDAAGCIQLGTGKNGQTMQNTCAEAVFVVWCSDRNEKRAWGCSICNTTDEKKGFYILARTMKPGEIEDNSMSLPANALITYAACFGGRDAYISTDRLGGYLCKPPKPVSGKQIITTAGASAEEACQRARVMAQPSGVAGECVCESRGNVFLCTTEFVGPMPTGPYTGP